MMASSNWVEIERGVGSEDWLKTAEAFFGEVHPVKMDTEKIPIMIPTINVLAGSTLPDNNGSFVLIVKIALFEIALFKIIQIQVIKIR